MLCLLSHMVCLILIISMEWFGLIWSVGTAALSVCEAAECMRTMCSNYYCHCVLHVLYCCIGIVLYGSSVRLH